MTAWRTQSASRAPRTGQRGVTLVELLVGITIVSVLSGMIILSWASLTQSYSRSAKSSEARDFAREAMARMVREIRAGQTHTSSPIILTGSPNEIVLTSSFNEAGNTNPRTAPRYVRYVLSGGTVYRQTAATLAGVTTARQEVVIEHVVNQNQEFSREDGTPTPLFQYTYTAVGGSHQTVDALTGLVMRQQTVSIAVRLMVDLNPGKSPVHIDLLSTAQLRNGRQS